MKVQVGRDDYILSGKHWSSERAEQEKYQSSEMSSVLYQQRGVGFWRLLAKRGLIGLINTIIISGDFTSLSGQDNSCQLQVKDELNLRNFHSDAIYYIKCYLVDV